MEYKSTLGIKTNATLESDIEVLVSETIKKFGKISGLINNVGWGANTPLWESDTDKMVKSYILNTVGAYNLTKMCMPHLEKEENASCSVSPVQW